MHKRLDNIRTRVAKLESLVPELRRRFNAVEELEKQLDMLFPDETEQREVAREALARAWYELQNVARHMTFEDTIIMNLGVQVEREYKAKAAEPKPEPLKLQGQASQLATPAADYFKSSVVWSVAREVAEKHALDVSVWERGKKYGSTGTGAIVPELVFDAYLPGDKGATYFLRVEVNWTTPTELTIEGRQHGHYNVVTFGPYEVESRQDLRDAFSIMFGDAGKWMRGFGAPGLTVDMTSDVMAMLSGGSVVAKPKPSKPKRKRSAAALAKAAGVASRRDAMEKTKLAALKKMVHSARGHLAVNEERAMKATAKKSLARYLERGDRLRGQLAGYEERIEAIKAKRRASDTP